MLYVNNLNYRSIGHHHLIKSFTHHFIPGKLYGLIGLNGSGKTTLLKLLSGIFTQTSGSIFWNETNLNKLSRIERSRLITLSVQALSINFDYTVEDIVTMGSYANKVLERDHTIVDSALKMVQASHLKSRLINQISNGEKQRVFLARALATQCKILLFDEPTACLDIKHQKIVWELLNVLKKENKVVIVATHDLEQAKDFCDEFLFVDAAQCIAKGDFNSIKPFIHLKFSKICPA